MSNQADRPCTEAPLPLEQAHALLERGFQECLALTATLQRGHREIVGRRLGSKLTEDEIVDELNRFSKDLYEVMARTLFRLIGMLQPEDCSPNRPVNLYFWPGYHCYLADKRIFIRDPDWNLGVGFVGIPPTDIQQADTFVQYDDCSQARWYQYLIKRRKDSAIAPIDIHRWLLKRTAAKHVNSLADSLTVTTTQLPHTCETSGKYLYLSESSGTAGWGEQLTAFVQKGVQPAAEFVDAQGTKRTGNEAVFLRQAKAKLQSLWLHSAFCSSEPPWLQAFIKELASYEDTQPVSDSLLEGLEDNIASDWSDSRTGRPPFCSWINISLRPWLDPEEGSIFKDESATDRRPQLAKKTVGSAAFLSSIPLRPGYVAFVRSWVSEVYNTIRNVEMSILFHNKELGRREAMMAGPYFAHEIQKIVDEGLATAQRDFADDSEEAARARRFVLYSIRTLCNLAYSFTNAMMSQDPEAMQKVRDDLVKPLQQLRVNRALLYNLTRIAEETYQSIKQQNGRINFPDTGEPQITATAEQHGACFLLISEMLRNYCQSQPLDSVAEFRTRFHNDTLTIELEGPTRAQRNAKSMTFTRLHGFLHTLGIGEASSEWDKKAGMYKFTVKVSFGSATISD